MRIEGGRVFISRDDDITSTLYISNAIVVCEVPAEASDEAFIDFVICRLARGSITGCTFMSLASWAERHAKDQINTAKQESKTEAPRKAIGLTRLVASLFGHKGE